MDEMRPLIVAEPMLRAPRPEMVAELNGASSARQSIAERKRTESDAKTHRTPKALRAKSPEASLWFRERFGSDGARVAAYSKSSSLDQRCGWETYLAEE
jgi:hypothetical protein